MSRRFFTALLAITAIAVVAGLVALAIIRAFVLTSLMLAPPRFSLAMEVAWSFLLFCFAVAGLTMAFIQVCRMLIPFRGLFQRRATEAWLEHGLQVEKSSSEAAASWSEALKNANVQEVSAQAALREFEGLGVQGERKKAFEVPLVYDLPLEQFSAQLTLAAESGLDRPMQFPHLLLCLVGVESAKDFSKLLTSSKREYTPEPIMSSEAMAEVQARGSLTRLIHRRIDAFQIETGGQWRRKLRGVAVSTSIGFSWLITVGSIPREASRGTWLSYLFYAGLAGILAAFLSTFLRDLTAIVELKRRQL
jgi:hypothetical protein